MAITPKYQLKDLFQTGDLISQDSMTNLIDSAYNPAFIAGSNIFITGIDTPSGRQITISSPGGSGGGTPAGSTNEVQYNDNGEFASDELFYRAADEFYVTSVMQTGDEMDIGQGDWENVIGVPIIGSGLTYFEGSSGLFSSLFVGNLSELGGGVGLLSFTQDDVTGNTAALSLSPDVIYFNLIRENESASIILDEFASSVDFANAEYKAYLSLENASAGLFLKDENSGEERSIAVVDSGVRINSALGFYTLPDGDGTAGQIIETDGNGNLTWETPSIPSIIPAYDNDAVAGTAGLATGDIYQTTGAAVNPLNVAGIMMVKQ